MIHSSSRKLPVTVPSRGAPTQLRIASNSYHQIPQFLELQTCARPEEWKSALANSSQKSGNSPCEFPPQCRNSPKEYGIGIRAPTWRRNSRGTSQLPTAPIWYRNSGPHWRRNSRGTRGVDNVQVDDQPLQASIPGFRLPLGSETHGATTKRNTSGPSIGLGCHQGCGIATIFPLDRASARHQSFRTQT